MTEIWVPDSAKKAAEQEALAKLVPNAALREVVNVARLHGPESVDQAVRELQKRQKAMKRKAARVARKRNRK